LDSKTTAKNIFAAYLDHTLNPGGRLCAHTNFKRMTLISIWKI